jgi:hypothetical protein
MFCPRIKFVQHKWRLFTNSTPFSTAEDKPEQILRLISTAEIIPEQILQRFLQLKHTLLHRFQSNVADDPQMPRIWNNQTIFGVERRMRIVAPIELRR